MYKAIFYNTSTYTIVPWSSTHPPMIDTTANGKTTSEFDASLIPANNALVASYNDATDTIPTDFATAFDSPQAWLYESGKFVANPNYDAMAFAQAQQAQLSALSKGLKSTLSGGFTAKTLVGSATSPHTYPTDAGAQANFTGAVAAFQANPNKTTVTIQTLDAGWISHTKAEFYGIYTDGDNWKEAQYPQLGTLQGKVKAMKLSDYATLADGIAAIQGVTWTPATY